MPVIIDWPQIGEAEADMELLWENPNPKATFGEQSVTVPDISNYGYLIFETGVCPTSATIPNVVFQTSCRVSDVLEKFSGYYQRPLSLTSIYTAPNATTLQRLVTFESLTSIRFFPNNQYGTTTAYNAVNVPLRIYGTTTNKISLDNTENLISLGWNGTYYSTSTGTAGNAGIYYINKLNTDYLTVSGNLATVKKAGKYLIHLSTSSDSNLNTADWNTLSINGTTVLDVPHVSGTTFTSGMIILDLKVGDTIGGIVHHTSGSNRVNFYYSFYYYN